MYNLLIVDDNSADRDGIPTMLKWDELGIRIAGTCSNGEEAMHIMDENKVDIVLTDIVMPIVNGIELAEYIKQRRFKTKVIFMSCYSDFEYAKSAVDMDINGYVLKPIFRAEFSKVIQKILDEFRNEDKVEAEKTSMLRQIHDSLPVVREQFVKELFLTNNTGKGNIHERLKFLQFDVEPSCGIVVLSMVINDYEMHMQDMEPENLYYTSFSIKETVAAHEKPGMKVYTVQFSGKDFSALIFLPPRTNTENFKDIVDMAVDIHTDILSRFMLSTTIGISKISKEITFANELYRQSTMALNTSFYYENNPIILYDSIESKSYVALDQNVNMEELYQGIKEIITMGEENAAIEFIDKYFRTDNKVSSEGYIKSLALSTVNMISVVTLELGHSFTDIFGRGFAAWKLLNRLKTISDIRQWLLTVFKTVRNHLTVKNQTRGSKLVDAVKQIVSERYQEQITVDDISRSAYLSLRYANSIFKKETGKTIFEYLLEYRLDAAKKLLMENQFKVSDIPEKVGYENKSYFALMFKKYVGLTPAEYRARFVK